MKVYPDRDSVERVLKTFVCQENREVEAFLHDKAIAFEELSKSRTYLICDENQLISDRPNIYALSIYGYISLAIKTLVLEERSDEKD